jgi:hypothetical protein
VFVYSASSSGPPTAEVTFGLLWALVYSASSSGPPTAESYFAGGRFTLLAVLVLLQRRVTLPQMG